MCLLFYESSKRCVAFLQQARLLSWIHGPQQAIIYGLRTQGKNWYRDLWRQPSAISLSKYGEYPFFSRISEGWSWDFHLYLYFQLYASGVLWVKLRPHELALEPKPRCVIISMEKCMWTLKHSTIFTDLHVWGVVELENMIKYNSGPMRQPLLSSLQDTDHFLEKT